MTKKERIAKYHEVNGEFHRVFGQRQDLVTESKASAQGYNSRIKDLESAMSRLHDQCEDLLWDDVQDFDGGIVIKTNLVTGEVRTRPLTVDERQGELDLEASPSDTDGESAPFDVPPPEPEEASSRLDTMGDAVLRALNGTPRGVGEIAAACRLDKRLVSQILRGLADDGTVIKAGQKRGTTYRLPATVLPREASS